jgi:hypothetical protein
MKPKPAAAKAEAAKEPVDATPAPGASTTKTHLAAQVLVVPPGLWEDPDVCWLTGAHVSGDHTYVVRESYEQLLWWLSLPRLLRIAESSTPQRADAATIVYDVNKALAALEAAGYKIDQLLEPDQAAEESAGPDPSSSQKPEKEALHTVPKTGPEPGPNPEKLEPQEPVAAKPVGPKDPEGPPEEY